MSGTITRKAAWRIARHDMRRHRRRTWLTIVVVALPVILGIIASSALLFAAGFSGPNGESLDTAPIYETSSPEVTQVLEERYGANITAFELAWVDAGGGAAMAEAPRAIVAHTPGVSGAAERWEGLSLVQGRWHESDDEVVVTSSCACTPDIGERITLGESDVTVVGIASIARTANGGFIDFLAPQTLVEQSQDGVQQSHVVTSADNMAGVREYLRFDIDTMSANVDDVPPGLRAGPLWFTIGLFQPGMSDVSTFGALFVLGAPLVAVVMLLIAFLVAPSFAITAAGLQRLVRRLTENGATTASAARVLGAQAKWVSVVAVVTGTLAGLALLAGTQWLIQALAPHSRVVAAPVALDVLLLIGLTVFMAVRLSAAVVARRAPTPEAKPVARRRWRRWASHGVAPAMAGVAAVVAFAVARPNFSTARKGEL